MEGKEGSPKDGGGLWGEFSSTLVAGVAGPLPVSQWTVAHPTERHRRDRWAGSPLLTGGRTGLP